jgi:hypothetical protein
MDGRARVFRLRYDAIHGGFAGRWVEEFWARGHSRGWYLLQTALVHPYGHWFDAAVTRGQLGIAGR